MLTTSPILSTSANASPASFRRPHAAARSPHGSPRQAPSRQRPKSSLAAASPSSQLRPKLQRHIKHSSSPSLPQPTEASSMTHSKASTNIFGRPPATPTPVSPSKRRGTSDAANTDPQVQPASQGLSTSPNISKRPRTNVQPPKILPSRYELCSVEDMVELIAHMVAELIATNDAIHPRGGLTRFHSRTAPAISVRDYLHRLAKHATLTPPLLLAMVYYIDRLCALYTEFTINTLTVHRFLITAATVAAKGLSDSFWNNTTYARVGGVRVAELKLLELEFLYRVDWRIVPNPEVLVAYYSGLIERTPGYALENDASSDNDAADDEQVDDKHGIEPLGGASGD
ncbi:hypothetical protein CDD82_3260 [Ophiocordyceps australis]|uniref:Cyclin n=1 Tax=Ophiocordyceps australis TaxID=1399860 RepID=A0A2C5ZE07_9HYPO|nr:hypothetical protein CDD82_3260 [Ophiocordyceps australis]